MLTPQWNTVVKDCVQFIRDKNGAVTGQVATLSCIPAIFSNLVNTLLAFAGIFALFLFIISGYKFINSAGEAKRLEAARNTLIFGILGLLIVLGSFLIINIVSMITGVPCITKFGFGCN